MMKLDGSDLLTGGLERYCRDLALLAADRGYDVTVYQKAQRAFEVELTDHVKVVGVPCSLRFRGNWELSAWLDRNTDTNAPFVFVSEEIALSKKIKRAAGVNCCVWWDGDFPWWKRWANKRLQYKLLTKLRGVICCDNSYINWCHAELPNRAQWDHKLYYIPNYADLDVFKPAPSPARTDDCLTILFPRRLPAEPLERHGKGAGLLLKAAQVLEKRSVRTRLLFVGRGELKGPIKEWAVENNMSDRVEVFEAPMDGMPAVYARADVVVVPSIEHEATALSALEGMLSGKPTVVSHIGGLGNIVIDGLNGHVCDLSPESLADAIQTAVKTQCVQKPGMLEACRESLGKPRWERKVWSALQHCLAL